MLIAPEYGGVFSKDILYLRAQLIGDGPLLFYKGIGIVVVIAQLIFGIELDRVIKVR